MDEQIKPNNEPTQPETASEQPEKKKHPILKWTLIVVGVFVVALVASSPLIIKYSNQKTESDMLNYLDSTYHNQFEADRFVPGSNPFTGNAYDRLVAFPKGRPDQTFEMHRHQTSGGGVRYEDDYAFIVAAENLQPTIANTISTDIGNSSVGITFNSSTQEAIYHPTGSFDEAQFLSAEKNNAVLNITAFASNALNESKDIRAEKLVKLDNDLKQQGFQYIGIAVVYVSTSELTKINPSQYTETGEDTSKSEKFYKDFSKWPIAALSSLSKGEIGDVQWNSPNN